MTVRSRNTLIRVTTLGMTVAAILAQAAVAQATSFDLPAQPLAQSLRAVGSATNVNVLFDPPLVRYLQAPELKGDVSTGEAIGRLLAGTGIRYEFLNANTVVVGADEVKLVRLAQADSSNQQASVSSESTESSAKLEEIVVTAQRRQERIQQVPISITALGGAELDRSTTGSVTDSLKAVPGVAVFDQRNGTGTTMTIRGVPGGGWGVPASIAYYLDSIPLSLAKNAVNLDAGSYDLDRIEVLRGPQGTLYGASAQAGVVRVLTKDPDVSHFEFKARGLLSGTKDGSSNYEGDAAANIPIIDDKLAARVTLGYKDFNGWIDKPGNKNINDTRLSNMRFKVRYEPSDKLTIDTSAWVVRTDSGGPSIGLPDSRSAALAAEPSIADYDVYNAKIAYDLGFATLSSASSYLDSDSGNVLSYEPLIGSDLLQFSEFAGKVFTEELQLVSKEAGVWQYSIGSFYRDARDLSQQSIAVASELSRPFTTYIRHLVGDTSIYPADTFLLGLARDTSRSYAVYGELTRNFADNKFAITGGLRYFNDKVGTLNYQTGYRDNDTFRSTSPRVVLTWHPKDDAMVYASVGKGFRSGELQDSIAHDLGFAAAKPEDLYNYELGSKATLFDGRIDVDGSVYFVKRKGIIQTLGVPVTDPVGGVFTTTSVRINGPSASGLGTDFAFTWHPARAFRLGINGSVNDLTFDKDVVTYSLSDSGDLVSHIVASSGDRTNDSPKTTLGAFTDFTFALGSAEATLAASISHRSSVLVNVLDAPPLVSGNVTVLGASLGLVFRSNWTVTAFIDNLTNADPVVVRDGFGPYWDVRTRPRTLGIQAEVRY